MPRDKTESHLRIVEAAKKEFLEYGFTEASLRRIAAKAGIQVSGLYKHFESKEAMFESLVGPAVNGFYKLYSRIEGEYFGEIDKIDEGYDWEGQRETIRMMEYMYDHLDEFILIITKSQGTKYEDFTHDVAELEEEVTIRYMEELKKAGFPVKDFDRNEFHLLVTAYISAAFQPIHHGFSREEAMHYAWTLEEFYKPAWKAWFGI
ncbi:MAG: TetR/AcrR family transcriptional regulator [Lachnospiraceae bacterium]|nr:TetR/AcrR family transcriptional regulator [Lachnospiraceae bacterium]